MNFEYYFLCDECVCVLRYEIIGIYFVFVIFLKNFVSSLRDFFSIFMVRKCSYLKN